jgi:tetratricopeptide (TPR) repeat protein
MTDMNEGHTATQRFGEWRLTRAGKIRPRAALCLLIAALTLVVYTQALDFEFLSLDDEAYVTRNSMVTRGLTLEGFLWSFSFQREDGTYWHPLAWLSHMLDVELFGLNPGAHHLMNVIFHLINALLLCHALERLTGALWPSGVAACLFAVHPINVESVAWVAERKNLLSTTFWLLSICAYASYSIKPGKWRYGLVTASLAAGLLTKPMTVTLPCVFLLIDWWPLRRWGSASASGSKWGAASPFPITPNPCRWRTLLVEKIPWVLLSLLTVFTAAGSLNALPDLGGGEQAAIGLRLQNALVSYATYLVKIFWPADLAMFYPYPMSVPLWKTVVSALLLAAISLYALRLRRSRPYFIIGWLWFLGTLVPVAGFVQAGVWPSWADRWAYTPSIGIFLVSVWGARDLIRDFSTAARRLAVSAAGICLLGLTLAAHAQAALWRADIDLYRRATEAVENNYFACSNLAEAYYRRAEFVLASEWFARALEYSPRFVPAHIGMANAMLASGKFEKASWHLQKALELNPHEKTAYNNLGVLHLQTGNSAEAIRAFEKALVLDARYAEAHNNVGFVYLRNGLLDLAAHHFGMALTLEPDNPMARENMRALSKLKRPVGLR